jgi:hypothetical protein
VFFTLGGILLIGGLIPFVNFLYLTFVTKNPFGPHHIQSLILGTVLLIASFISFTLGIIADLIRINRVLTEEVLEFTKKQYFKKSKN